MAQLLTALGVLLFIAVLVVVLAFEFGSGSRHSSTLSNRPIGQFAPGATADEIYELEGGSEIDPNLGDDQGELSALEEEAREGDRRIERLERRRREIEQRGPDVRGYQTVLVEPGDTLRTLAQRHLGDDALWRELITHNLGKIRHASDLHTGMTLRIPTWLAVGERR